MLDAGASLDLAKLPISVPPRGYSAAKQAFADPAMAIPAHRCIFWLATAIQIASITLALLEVPLWPTFGPDTTAEDITL